MTKPAYAIQEQQRRRLASVHLHNLIRVFVIAHTISIDGIYAQFHDSS